MTCDSILRQTFTNYEVWIINGGNDLETKNFLEELKFPFHSISECDAGIYDAMNKGILKSKGEWLYFLGSGDTFSESSTLEKIASNFESDTKIISGKVKYSGTQQPFIYSKSKKIKNPSWNFLMWFRNGLHHQGTFYHSSLFKENHYNLTYSHFADYHQNLLFYKNRIKISMLDLIVANCLDDGVSKSGEWNLYKEELDLKIDITSKVLFPFFYSIIFVKYFLRKIINAN